MPGISSWTWRRRDGTTYRGFDALWRRIADRPWERDYFSDRPYADVFLQQFGPMTGGPWAMELQHIARFDDYDGTAREQVHHDTTAWKRIHRELVALAALWHPSPEDADIQTLDPLLLQGSEHAAYLRSELETASLAGELPLRLTGWEPRITPTSLRGYLLYTAVTSIGAEHRFRRCDQCREWFVISRADARYCSSACRKAAHLASKEKM